MFAVVHVLALLATGGLVLFASFTLLAGISPDEVAGPASVALAVAVVLGLRGLRIERELRSRAGSPDLRLAASRQRERRGF